jgi:hypothetical protein
MARSRGLILVMERQTGPGGPEAEKSSMKAALAARVRWRLLRGSCECVDRALGPGFLGVSLPSRLKLLFPLEVAVLLEFQGLAGPDCRWPPS